MESARVLRISRPALGYEVQLVLEEAAVKKAQANVEFRASLERLLRASLNRLSEEVLGPAP